MFKIYAGQTKTGAVSHLAIHENSWYFLCGVAVKNSEGITRISEDTKSSSRVCLNCRKRHKKLQEEARLEEVYEAQDIGFSLLKKSGYVADSPPCGPGGAEDLKIRFRHSGGRWWCVVDFPVSVCDSGDSPLSALSQAITRLGLDMSGSSIWAISSAIDDYLVKKRGRERLGDIYEGE